MVSARARRAVFGALALVGALAGVALPAVAVACPACAGRTGDETGHGRAIVIGAFVLMPWGLAWGVSRIVKRGEAIDKRGEAVDTQTEGGKPPGGGSEA